MVVGAELEYDLEQKEPSEDKEFIKDLISQLLPKVEEAYARKSGQITEIQNTSDPNIMPFGGNIEHQQLSGQAVIEALKNKLSLMNSSPIDLQSIDYSCLERVLNFLERRGENWSDELSRLRGIEQEAK